MNDVPVFHPDVSVYKVENKNDGKFVGLWYFDPYARTGKRSGAWMTAYREQNTRMEMLQRLYPTIAILSKERK
ncbi:MAG: M3 family metallopeptidase [Bacteroidia bacterium]